ncbi:nucleotide-diphospho-sugar transferase [Xylaria bambusicola]|uniref:nucleotide-diphospho-sugar transferase n=1 Tax=Xylaria bambusicola TaxID=326684 RepID=UPI002007883C|nr:nucleotide-diphospho-sugar transferase [Xylaria bambusicola]KAI0517553.1 nucleotide-diphospho-sugar transferase [Xylaria bambusicola]
MPAQKPFKIQHGPYQIERFPPRHPLQKSYPLVTEYAGLATEFIWAAYITLEWLVVFSLQLANSKWIWKLWLLLFAEAASSVSEILSFLNTVFVLLVKREAAGPRPSYRLVGNVAPSVDIMIPCCKEAVDVVMDTVKAALAIDYPSDKFRVFILDDGKDDVLREAVETLKKNTCSADLSRLHYLSRTIKAGQKSHYKSGNLQYGIEETGRMSGSEYLASLDADMIPDKNWLRAMVPHLILEDNLALACPPQRYYNVPGSDPFGQQAEFDVFLDVYEPMDDRLDPAMCTGSGFVVKREAIAAIGGWPLVDSGEDFIGASMFSYSGWTVAYIREQLQIGLAPNSIRAHIRQRERWVDSGVVVHKHFKFYIPGLKENEKMPWNLRGVGVLGLIREYAPVFHILGLMLLPLAVLMLSREAHSWSHNFSWLRGVLVTSLISRKIGERLLFGNIGQSRIANLFSNDVWTAPYTAVRCVLSLLPESFHTVSFVSTATIVSNINERSRLQRMPLPHRLFNLDFMMPAIYFVVVSGLLFSSSDILGVPLLTGAILRLFSYFWKVAIPIVYIIAPPTVPERSELIAPDEEGNNRPTEQAVTLATGNPTLWSWGDIIEVCAACWCLSS